MYMQQYQTENSYFYWKLIFLLLNLLVRLSSSILIIWINTVKVWKSDLEAFKLMNFWSHVWLSMGKVALFFYIASRKGNFSIEMLGNFRIVTFLSEFHSKAKMIPS